MNEQEKGHFFGHQAFGAVVLLTDLLNKALSQGRTFSWTISEDELRVYCSCDEKSL
jgi:hypothetical protein